jgi:hypothetical protein
MAEVLSKAALKEATSGGIERLARAEVLEKVVGDRGVRRVGGLFDAALNQIFLF